jgi:hypothetical protein
VALAAHTLSVCKRHLAHELLPLIILLFTTTIDLRLIGTSPDEDLIFYVHVAHGLEVSSQTNSVNFWEFFTNSDDFGGCYDVPAYPVM